MPKIVDITGPIYEGMWTYGEPYAPFRMEQVPPVDWVAYPTYSQNVSMNVQTGAYLETGAHMYPGMRTVDQLRPEDLFLDTHVLYLQPKDARAMIQADELKSLTDGILPGKAILICAAGAGTGKIRASCRIRRTSAPTRWTICCHCDRR